MKISVFGAGYVGLVTSACLADLGHLVMCADNDTHKIDSLSQGNIPFFEPGLNALLKKTYSKGKLRFTSNSREAVEFGDVIFLCVGTPSTSTGGGGGAYGIFCFSLCSVLVFFFFFFFFFLVPTPGGGGGGGGFFFFFWLARPPPPPPVD